MLCAAAAARAQDTAAPKLAGICAACHGQAGVPVGEEIPVIWGQNEGYLYLQLRDMKKGARAVPAMAAVVALLDKPQMQKRSRRICRGCRVGWTSTPPYEGRCLRKEDERHQPDLCHW